MKNLFLALWAASHLVYFYAFVYSDMPNQIHFAFTGLVFLVGMVGLIRYSPFGLGASQRGGMALMGLVLLYIASLWVVSLWEMFPGTAAPYFKFEMIHLAVAANAYLVGRIATQRQLLTTHAVLGLALMVVTVAQILTDPDQPRYGYGIQTMLCVSAMLMLGWRWMTAAGLLVILASMHKTTLGCALLGVLVILWKADIPAQKGNRYVRAILQPLLATVIVGCAVVYLMPYMGSTLERLLPEDMYFNGLVGERSDPQREYIHNLSVSLLPEHWISGMGYMNFFALTESEATVIYQIDRFGESTYGTNLHNSYMTWALEGGLLVCSIVALIFWRAGGRLRFIWNDDRNMGVLLAAWCAAALLFGWFHQLHSSVQFWSILGIIFGYRDQLAARHRLARLDTRSEHRPQTALQPQSQTAGLPGQFQR